MIRKIISLLTFPGVIFHELGHQIFCHLTGIKVFKVCYFRFGNPAGYVEHEEPRNFLQALLISTGPFTFGTIISIICFLISKNIFQASQNKAIFFIWLGVAIAVNCFPSKQDAKNLFHDTNKNIFKNPLAIIGYPFVIILYVFQWLSVLYLDIIYAAILYFISNNFIYNYLFK